MKNSLLAGHFTAFFTTSVWSITFISTKYLIREFDPTEILIIRFIIAATLLKIISPRGIPFKFATEKYFALAGFTGIFLYFILENTGLTLTTAANAGVIVALAPLFTAIASWIFLKDRESMNINFFIGLCLAVGGVAMLSFKGSDFEIHPFGDLLVVLACVAWGIYSVTIKKITTLGYNNIAITRRSFLWGLFFALPFLFCSNVNVENFNRYSDPAAWSNLLFLGAIASALCFATWNLAVKILGAVRTSVYIYSGPALTVIFAYLCLGEELNLIGIIGCILTTAGLVISSLKIPKSGHGDHKITSKSE